jgi:hypothetical protein
MPVHDALGVNLNVGDIALLILDIAAALSLRDRGV